MTDHNFARRMKDTLHHGYRNFRETISLKWGRHFRINESVKMIVGRDKEENESLMRYAHPDDVIMQLPRNDGPTVIIKSKEPDQNLLSLAAGLLQRYSKYQDQSTVEVNYWYQNNKNEIKTILSQKLDETFIRQISL